MAQMFGMSDIEYRNLPTAAQAGEAVGRYWESLRGVFRPGWDSTQHAFREWTKGAAKDRKSQMNMDAFLAGIKTTYHAKSNPQNPIPTSDHYTIGYKAGAKAKTTSKRTYWSRDDLKQVQEGAARKYSDKAGGDYHETSNSGHEWLTGYVHGFFSDKVTYGVVPHSYQGAYTKDKTVFTSPSMTKVRRWADENQDTLPPHPGGYVPYFSEVEYGGSSKENPGVVPPIHEQLMWLSLSDSGRFLELAKSYNLMVAGPSLSGSGSFLIKYPDTGKVWLFSELRSTPTGVARTYVPSVWSDLNVERMGGLKRNPSVPREFVAGKVHPYIEAHGSTGWVLEDEDRDQVAGPFKAESDARKVAQTIFHYDEHQQGRYAAHSMLVLAQYAGGADSIPKAVLLPLYLKHRFREDVLENPGKGESNPFTPRFVPTHLMQELINLYHTARTAVGSKPYDRMVKASEWYHKEHPETSATAAYKDLSDWLNEHNQEFVVRGRGRSRGGKRNPSGASFYMPVMPDGLPTQDALDLYGITGKVMTAQDAREANKVLVESGRPERFKSWTKARMKAFGDMYLKHGLRQNPTTDDASSDAAAMYAAFHGRESGETLRYHEEEEYEDSLAVLGEMVELKVATLTKKDATIGFTGSKTVLACNATGTQLYLVGGDQSIDLKALGFTGEKASKTTVALGTAYELTYRTEKGFDKFKLTDYYHEIGEETGFQPIAIYNTLNQTLEIAGGEYKCKPEGIVN